MKILAVDDERNALETLVDAIHEAVPEASVYDFRSAEQALSFAAENPCEVAFMDIEMRGISGIELAKRLKGRNPHINIVFVTGYSQYTADALQLRASGYIMKPPMKEDILLELDNLRNPIKRKAEKRIWAQTFGNFEFFIDNTPVHFKYNKTKELLAYLIDRKGALCTGGELMGALWEDESGDMKKAAYLRKLKQDLTHTLEMGGCADILTAQPGKLGIVPEKIECDYYDMDEGKVYALNAYHGEYMSQYSWAEITHSTIETSVKTE